MKILLAAVLCGASCSVLSGCGEREEPGLVVSLAELGPPDGPDLRPSWTLERVPGLSAGVVALSGNRWGFGANPGARTRLLILSGTARVRVGTEERILREGALVSVPAGVTRRVSSVGPVPLRFLRVLIPDIDHDAVWELPRGGTP
jgi:hypothetical protein